MISHQRGLVALYSAVFILAINGVLCKSIALNAVTITSLRCAIAFTVIALFFTLTNNRQRFRLTSTKSILPIIVVGLLMSVHWSSFFHSMQISTVAIGILAHYCYPVITVLLEAILNRKMPALSDLLASLGVIVGVAIMVPSWQLDNQAFIGAAFGLLSALTWASRNVLQGRWLAHESGQTIMLYQLLVIVGVTCILIDWEQTAQLDSRGWLLLLVLGTIGTAFGHTLFSIALRAINAKSISLISCLQPPVAIFLSWLLLNEVPSINTLFGGAIILAIASFEAAKQGQAATHAKSKNP